MIPVYEGQNVAPQLNITDNTRQGLQVVADASDRLLSRLSGVIGAFKPIAEKQLSEDTINKALTDVEEGKVDSESVALVAEDLYRQTARSALTAKMQNNSYLYGESVLQNQKASNRYDVESFTKNYDAYANKTLNGIKDPSIRYEVEQTLAKERNKYASTITALQIKQQTDNMKADFEANLKLKAQDMSKSWGVNNDEVVKSYTQIEKTLGLMVTNGMISEGEADLKLKEITDAGYVEAELRAFRNSDNPTKFLEEFRKNEYGLDNETLDKTIQRMQNVMRSQIQDRTILSDQAEKEHESFVKNSKNSINYKLVQGTLTEDDINGALALGIINRSEYDDLRVRMKTPGVDKSDDATYFQYRANLDHTSIEAITQEQSLSRQDKEKLITALNSEENQMRAQAYDEIDNRFGMFKGTLMSKLDFNNDNGRDYAIVKREFFDKTQELKPEDQTPSKYVELARQILKEYDAGEVLGTKKYREAQSGTLDNSKINTRDYIETQTGIKIDSNNTLDQNFTILRFLKDIK